MRVAFIVEYDGTSYAGWQIQKNDVTIQQKIEEALLPMGKGRIAVFGAGRTDSGVHAKGQCGHFDIETSIPAEKFAPALNGVLPEDIKIIMSNTIAIADASPTFWLVCATSCIFTK